MMYPARLEDHQANGNKRYYRVFRMNAEQRHNKFKAFFLSVVDPVKPVKERKSNPNYKVSGIIKHAINVSRRAMLMGEVVSLDDQTIGCKERHPDIQRITCKFQADSICADGHRYSIHFRNVPPAPKECIEKERSPLHTRCIEILEQLAGKYNNMCTSLEDSMGK